MGHPILFDVQFCDGLPAGIIEGCGVPEIVGVPDAAVGLVDLLQRRARPEAVRGPHRRQLRVLRRLEGDSTENVFVSHDWQIGLRLFRICSKP